MFKSFEERPHLPHLTPQARLANGQTDEIDQMNDPGHDHGDDKVSHSLSLSQTSGEIAQTGAERL